MIWTPEAQDVFRAYAAVYGSASQNRDPGLVDSTVGRPSVRAFGEEQYRTVADKAAALLDAFCRNHPLVDGNKRCGWIAVRLTYFRNLGAVWVAGDDAAYELVMSAADEHLAVSEIAEVLEQGFS